MTIAKVEVERFSLTSSKPFDAVVAALKSAVGQPDMVEFFKATRATNSFPDLERVVQSGLGRTDLMLFAEFDLGDILRRETGSKTPKIIRLVVGNPLIMKEMVKHVPDAGSYAPVTVLIDERPDGVHVSYDKMESLSAALWQLGSTCRRPKSRCENHDLAARMCKLKRPDDVFGRSK